MANSNSNLDLISASQANKEVTANSLLDAASPAMLYGRRASATAALTWGYYGGTVSISGTPTQVANGTVALAASTTNYVEANSATGAVSVNQSGFTAGHTPLYTVVTGSTAVASYVDLRVLGGGSSASGTVTSVGLSTAGVLYSVSGSPVTGSGTLALSLINQNANMVLAGPASGAAAAPSFRSLTGADLPVFVGSGASHAAGAVPDPGATAGTTRFLREDGGWATPAGSGGTVTSVDLSVPGLLYSVSGNPVTTSGTLTFSLKTQSANTFLAGPTSGSAAVPTMRAITGSDLPLFGASGAGHAPGAVPDPGSTAGTTRYLREDGTWSTPSGTSAGTVTSVALSVPGLLYSVSGSPVTSSGTLAFSLNNQNANTFLAGPTSGAAAAPTMRALVAADMAALLAAVNVFTKNQSVTPVALTDGATISVDASLSNNFSVTLGGNRTLANPTNLTAGMVLNFAIDQDATGSRTLAFGSLYKFAGTNTLSTTANAKDLMSCYYDGTILRCSLNKGFA